MSIDRTDHSRDELTLDQALVVVKNIATDGPWEPDMLLREKAMAMLLMYVQGAFPRRSEQSAKEDGSVN